MGNIVKNISNQKFGRFLVKKFMYVKKESAYWLCVCDCGNEKIVKGYSLRSGATKSCGCWAKENGTAQLRKVIYRHGKSKTKVYRIFFAARSRCINKKNQKYRTYGERGIKFLWNSFEEFYRDMGDPPSEEYSLDRKDNNGNYSKSNCRWATREEQANNCRSNKNITYKGKTQSLARWCRELKLKYSTTQARILKGKMSIEDILKK